MAQERSEAVVLRSVDYSNTSRIVTFLSPIRGRLACIARGARRPGNTTGPVIDTFNRLELTYTWKDSRTIQTLTGASILDTYAAVKADYERALHAAFPLELAAKLSEDNAPAPELYEALVLGLEQTAAWPGDRALHAAWHGMRLLVANGLCPLTDECALCGAAVPDGMAGFTLEGGVACGACKAPHRITAATRDALRAVVAASAGCPDAAEGPALLRLVAAYAGWQAEASFESLRVLAQVTRT